MTPNASLRRIAAARRWAILLALLAAYAPATADAACPPGTKAWMSMGRIVCLEPGFAPSAEDQCQSLLTSVTPESEARRVYNNCRAMITKKGVVTCPDGRQVAPANTKLCSSR